VNRYDHTFRSLPKVSRAGAIQKVGFARDALLQHRNNGFGPEDDEAIVKQFDLSNMTEYWEIELSEPMECHAFAYLASVHFFIIDTKGKTTAEELKATAPAASKIVDHIRAGVMTALRAARAAGEPWFIEVPEPPPGRKLDPNAWFGFVPSDVVIVPPSPPSDGIDLSKLKVRPRAAGEWMLGMPKRRHLVPPSLAAMLKSPASSSVQQSRGRTRGTSFAKADRPLAERMNAMVTSGEASSPSAAAWKLIGRDGAGAEGRGEPEAKVKRLVTAAKALRAENNGE